MKWKKIGYRLELKENGRILRQEKDLTDFIGYEEIEREFKMELYRFDKKYWYFRLAPSPSRGKI